MQDLTTTNTTKTKRQATKQLNNYINQDYNHSRLSEESLLACLIKKPSLIENIIDVLSVDDFYFQENKFVFEILIKMYNNDQTIDVITLIEYLQKIDKIDKIGGKDYLKNLVINLATVKNYLHYVNQIKNSAVFRRTEETLMNCILLPKEINEINPNEYIELVGEKVFTHLEKIAVGRSKNEIVSVADLTSKTIANLDNPDPGLTFGFTAVDKLLQRVASEDFIIIAARPSMGKTTFALNIADFIASQQNLPVLFFTLEVSANSLIEKLIANKGNINHEKIKNKQLTAEQWLKIAEAKNKIDQQQLYFVESCHISPLNIRNLTKRFIRKHGKPGAIMIDYLQLMEVYNKTENRTQEIALISRSLKSLALEIGVPVIALSQLNRGSEQRQDKRPMMSDLRESGSLEQDADIVMMLYRDEVYNPGTAIAGETEVIISKNRNGPIGTAKIKFEACYSRFTD